MNVGFLFGTKIFCKLLSVSWKVCDLHGYDWIHWVANSCTTTGCRWLFRDSQPSLRTLWSAVIKSPKIPARGTTLPVRLLHGALVILVLWQISHLRSEKNWRATLCVQELCHPQDSLWNLAAIPACRKNTGLPVLARDPHFYLGFFLILVGSFNNPSDVSEEYGSSRTCLSTLSLDTIVGGWPEWSISDEGVMGVEVEEDLDDQGPALKGVMGVEVGKLEEELVDKTGTTIGTKFSVVHSIRIPFSNEVWFLTVDPFVWVFVFIAKLSER